MKDDLITRVQKDVHYEQKHRDGVTQIAVGIFLILTAFLMFTKQITFVGIFIILIPLITENLRKRYTYPRIGYAKLQDKSTGRMLRMWLIAGILVLGIVFMIAFNKNLIPREIQKSLHIWLMFFVGAAILVLLVVRYLQERNKYLIFYGAFIVILVLGIWLLKLRIYALGYIFGGFGLLNLLYGLITLNKFIKMYPVLKDEN